MIRLSIGLETADDLIRDLERAQDFSAEAIAERYLQIYRNVVR